MHWTTEARRRRNARRGTAMVLVVVASVIITGFIMTLAWAAGVQSQITSKLVQNDEAFYVAEGSAQKAIWYFKQDQTWRAQQTPLTGTQTVNGHTYSFSVTCTDSIGPSTLAWKFDEGTGSTAADSSGNGNTGTLHGGTSWVTGRSGKAIDFDGTSGYVDCGNGASTNLTGDISMAAWVKLDGAAYDQKIGANQSGTSGGYKLCIYNSKVEFEVRDASNNPWLNRNIGGGTLLTVGSWYHVVGVYSETNHTIRTYVNGQLDREMTGLPANALATTNSTFIIGREPFSPTLYFFNGVIDDVRMFNRALTPAEVSTLYDTTVDIGATVTGGGVSQTLFLNASIPTPPAPTAPAITTTGSLTLKGLTVYGDIATAGSVTGASPNTTINGNLTYGGSYTPNGKITVVSPGQISSSSTTVPTIDYTSIKNQAGQTYTGNQSGVQFAFNSLGGNKVIYVNGNVTNPTFYIGGVYPSGGTLIVSGSITFGDNAAAVGSPGYPIYLISQSSITTGSNFTITGGLYAETNWTRKSCTVNGLVSVKGTITDNAGVASAFNVGPIPWFDPRAVAQQTATLPLYFTSFRGARP